MQDYKIFAGSSHQKFAEKICDYLKLPLGKSTSFAFSNDNRFATIDEAVRGQDIYVVQTGCEPVDVHLMELLIFIRSLRDASAGKITAVLPYLPYARSDKKDQPRVCITAKLVADLIEQAGANQVLIMEMHSPQLHGFFNIPCDHLLGSPVLIKYLKEKLDLKDYVLVAGDAGAAKMVKDYADGLHLPVAIMDKRREANDEKPVIKGIIGDVENKKVLFIDDEVASGGTLIKDTEYLLEKAGAKSVDACFVHAILGGDAVEKLNNSKIKRFITTDTLPTANKKLRDLEVVSTAHIFGECIKRMHEAKSIRSLNEV